MENDNKGFPVSPCHLPGSEHQTNQYQATLGGTTSSIEKTSINVHPLKPVSWITQKVTSGYNSHPSSSGPTMSSIQSNFMASNPLLTNSKNEDPNPGHDPFGLLLGKRVLDGIPIKNKQGAKLQGRDSSKLGFREPNSNDYIFSNM